MRFVRRTSMALVVASLCADCTTAAVQSRDPSDHFSAAMRLTGQEIAKIARPTSLLDALQRLRPQWLNSHGVAPGVSLDGAPPVDMSLLRDIPAITIQEVRFERAISSVGGSRILPNGDLIVGDMI